MVRKYAVLNQIQKGKIVAVIRGQDEQDTIEISKACIRGGIKNIEVTFTSPNAQDVIKKLVQENKDALIGAGTVLDEQTARIAILNGAEYVVSPHFDKEISKICNRYSIPYMPGCSSVTDIVEALASGVDVVKAFPGGILGPAFIKNVKGPLPYAEIMPSGGVNYDNILEWIESGSFAVGVGSELTKGIEKGQYEIVENRARQYVEKVQLLSANK
ncbi:bifunctional 2-keto-4-hydroxyglutarate aldolase/2-keto-3-deoxy-6-phosphogluconate aldolase [Niallia sp. NCCP-28]|uniref:bifunctional 2-keto-4-hydroxyglutarate aldolase/2-keto-3-deoxy-6-phosphogluconate aldolase n=1 Tax=Niallia sp. NCCP-28 TaxID=2934712 RepID=UPI0020802FF5|nr:bifunctional 2-keto-4-hydroxyglutarate aldolase/2-keto-3-deoxy-6-phosphogluconate aldolase [Niallia sp. NCCP-28]GKU82260.1 2-dehydro-3-deoxy-phosphogluconate aldolase [Niallia sp. NCCP-28]